MTVIIIFPIYQGILLHQIIIILFIPVFWTQAGCLRENHRPAVFATSRHTIRGIAPNARKPCQLCYFLHCGLAASLTAVETAAAEFIVYQAVWAWYAAVGWDHATYGAGV